MDKICGKCGGSLEAGFTTAVGLIGGDKAGAREPQLVFVVPGTRSSANPIKAFQQGLADEPTNRVYGIIGSRCSGCGALDLYAGAESGT